MSCPVSYILDISRMYCTYDKNQIMHAVSEETGELSTEVAIDLGYKDREPGPDGVVGEAVDLIITAVDMINAQQPGITVEEIQAIVAKKCAKWVAKVEKKKLAAYEARSSACCCPPPGHKGIWAAALCPVHFGFRSRQIGGFQC